MECRGCKGDQNFGVMEQYCFKVHNENINTGLYLQISSYSSFVKLFEHVLKMFLGAYNLHLGIIPLHFIESVSHYSVWHCLTQH